MKAGLKGLLTGAALVLAAASAGATTIDIDTYVTGSATGNVSVGTIDLIQDGYNVIFTVNNTVGNLGAWWQSNTAIDYIKLNYSGSTSLNGGSPTNTSGQSFTLSSGNSTDAGHSFNLTLDYPNPNASRFTNGETSSFTLENVNVSDFLNPSDGITGMAHVIGLSNEGSVKVGGSVDNPAEVPEPATLGLLGAGLFGIGMFRRRRLRAA